MSLATFNSQVLPDLAHHKTAFDSPVMANAERGLYVAQTCRAHLHQALGLLARRSGWLLFAFCYAAWSSSPEPAPTFKQSYEQAKKEYDAHHDDVQAAWHFARATFDLADFVSSNSERAEVAQEGIAACKQALAKAPDSAPLHYYLGLNQGELARTRTLGALSLVDQMEQEFTRAIALDASFDYAGPERSLGLLYRDAPVLMSIGSKTKARIHLQRALELAPRYPENRLNLIESELKWGDRKGARRDLKLLEDDWTAAHAEFAGPAWTTSWSDWDARLQKVRKTLEEPPRIESPRH